MNILDFTGEYIWQVIALTFFVYIGVSYYLFVSVHPVYESKPWWCEFAFRARRLSFIFQLFYLQITSTEKLHSRQASGVDNVGVYAVI